ncbi:MAG: hypothetical protein ACOYL3_02830 [Desulfuromonadaceae bacterium]
MKRKVWVTATVLLFALVLTTDAIAGDLDDVKSRGVLRHIGIVYANFNTGSGDGMEWPLNTIRSFSRR